MEELIVNLIPMNNTNELSVKRRDVTCHPYAAVMAFGFAKTIPSNVKCVGRDSARLMLAI